MRNTTLFLAHDVEEANFLDDGDIIDVTNFVAVDRH